MTANEITVARLLFTKSVLYHSTGNNWVGDYVLIEGHPEISSSKHRNNRNGTNFDVQTE